MLLLASTACMILLSTFTNALKAKIEPLCDAYHVCHLSKFSWAPKERTVFGFWSFSFMGQLHASFSFLKHSRPFPFTYPNFPSCLTKPSAVNRSFTHYILHITYLSKEKVWPGNDSKWTCCHSPIPGDITSVLLKDPILGEGSQELTYL